MRNPMTWWNRLLRRYCPAERQDAIDDALTLLLHFHADHTNALVTRFKHRTGAVYVVSDPLWRGKLDDLVGELFVENRDQEERRKGEP